jgi:hypothetical protein
VIAIIKNNSSDLQQKVEDKGYTHRVSVVKHILDGRGQLVALTIFNQYIAGFKIIVSASRECVFNEVLVVGMDPSKEISL